MTLNEDDVEWIKRKIGEYYVGKFSVDDPEFQKRALERRTRSMMRGIEETKPPDIRKYVETELGRAGYRDAIENIRREIRKTNSEEDMELNELGKRINATLAKVKKEDPDYLAVIEKFATTAAIELKQKREGIDSERSHIQPKR